MLVLEITETQMMADPSRTVRLLESLAQLGIEFSVDDFGTGYSSLSYLQRLPVHEIKVDKSFVLGMTADDANTKIVRSIVDLGHNLGLRVVAEGVEDRHHVERARRDGVRHRAGLLPEPPPPRPAADRVPADAVDRRTSEHHDHPVTSRR